MKYFDVAGQNHLVCSLVLFVTHGARDFLITAIPPISSRENSTSGENDEVGFFEQFYAPSPFNSRDEVACCLKEGWASASVGGVLGAVHIGAIVPYVLSIFVTPKLRPKYFLVASLVTSGILSLFMELADRGGTTVFILVRLLQGVLLGWNYPLIYSILETSKGPFVIPYSIIFLAPWFGSSVGMLMGLADNSFTGGYVFGGLCIVVGVLTLFFSLEISESEYKPEKPYFECLTSAPVLSCLLLQITTIWSLQTFTAGFALTLDFQLFRRDLLWYVPIALLIGGIVTRLVATTAMHLLRSHFLTPLNRRRAIISVGTIIVTISLITNGSAGINSNVTLFIMTILGIIGVGVLLIGIRLNLHDLGPIYPTPLLILGSISTSVGAALGSLLFPVMAKISEVSSTEPMDEGPWRVAWMVPFALVVVACCLHSFLLSVIPLLHQSALSKNIVPNILVNGALPPKEETDAKSFKSTKSAFSFKSAVSKHRTRTTSFKTVDENIEADLQSVIESKNEDCISIAQDNDSEDMKSVKSELSFKSAPPGRTSFDARQYGVILNAQGLDPTSAWLSTHHNADKEVKQTSFEKEMVERNVLIALPW